MATSAPTSTSQHAGKTVLVTGGGGGLGRVVVEHFLSLGANVVTCDINTDLLADLEVKVTSAYPEQVLALKLDITSEEALDELFSKIQTKFGKLDYVVNSAGIMDRFDPAGTLDRALFERVLAVNLIAPTMISKRAIELWQKVQVQGAAIVNIASVAAFKGGAAGRGCQSRERGVEMLTACDRCCVYGIKTRYSWPHKEHGSFLSQERHSMQCYPGGCYEYQHRLQHGRGSQPAGHGVVHEAM
jgi:NAD(P)-dependent dehydrogenase (short-subunit alcohol dehydrogenase family)